MREDFGVPPVGAPAVEPNVVVGRKQVAPLLNLVTRFKLRPTKIHRKPGSRIQIHHPEMIVLGDRGNLGSGLTTATR